MKPVRILHVLGAMNRGGAETRLLELMRRADPAQVQFEFCALSGQAGTMDDQVERLGGTIHLCRFDRGFAPRFLHLLRARQVDVVHSHVFLTSGLVLALARAAGVRRRIAHFRSVADERGTSWPREIYRSLMRLALDANATDILAVSTGAMAIGWSPDWARDPRCRVILNGIELDRYQVSGARASVLAELGLPSDARLVVQVGSFRPEKNHRFAADVVGALREGHVIFVGRGGSPEEADCRARLAANGGLARAHFVGERDDVGRWLSAADVSLLTSHREGLSGAVLESLAAGTPVVASDIPGVREIAGHLPGVTIHRLDEPPARWAQSLTAGLRAPPDAAARAAAIARFRASPFSVESCLAAHLEVWLGVR